MINKLTLFIISFLFVNVVALHGQSGCPNTDFSMGNFTGWQGFTGSFTNCCPTAGIVNGRHTIINAPGTDPRTGNNLQMIPPGANFSARLGNHQVGAEAERLRYTLTVTPQNALFIYKYAVVLEDPGHTAADQPKFNIRVLNQAGTLVDPVCGFYSVYAAANQPGFQTAPGTIRWKNWTNVGIDLTPYMGQTITIEYTTYDCKLSGHYGYAYLAATCAPMEISVGFCAGNATVTMNAPEGFVSYQWTPGGQTTQSITITNPVVGTNYSCLMTSHNGCQVTLNAILQPTIVEADFNITSAACSFTVNFEDNSTVNQGSVDTWQWNFGNGQTSTQQNPTHTYTTPGVYTVTLTASSVGCTDVYTQTLNVFPPPVANAGSPQIICSGQSANFTASGGTTYLWSTGATTPNINVSPAVTTTYTVTVSDANGCSDSDDVVLTVNPSPNANAGSDAQICYGTSTNLNASGGNAYFWSPSTGLSTANIPNPVANPTSTATYTVTVSDANGCTNTDNVIVNVMPLPPADAGAHQTICEGDQATLTASGGIDYLWNTGEPMSNINVSPAATTTYNVTVTDANGCSAADNVVVTVNYPPPADAGNDTSICNGTSTTLNASGGVTYQWSPATGLSSTNIAHPVANPTSPITYTVTVSDANGCAATDNVFIGIYPAPSISFTANLLSGCEPLSVLFTDNTTPAIQSWEWNFGDPASYDNISTQQNPSHQFVNPGIYTITLSIITTDGCTGTHSIPNMIEVYPNPVADFFLSPTTGSIENPIIFFQDQSYLANAWHWDFGDPGSGNLNNSNEPNPNHYYSTDDTYTISLLVETVHGCIDTTSKEVIIKPDFTFYIPNVFTPDGDGMNDFFQGYGTNISEYEMSIFNRWGEMLYETDDYNRPWDGKNKFTSEVMMQDVYVYRIIIIDINGKTHKYYGHVTLLR